MVLRIKMVVLFFILFILYPSMSLSNGGGWIHGYVRDEKGNPVEGVKIHIFDGFNMTTVETDNQGFYTVQDPPVSTGLYAALFYTKDGYIPIVENIKVEDLNVQKKIDPLIIRKGNATNRGFLVGTIYQPIRGGKLQFHKGIYTFGKNKEIWLRKEGKLIQKTLSDENGHFRFSIPSGRYTVGLAGEDGYPVEVIPRRTVIINIRSGLALID